MQAGKRKDTLPTTRSSTSESVDNVIKYCKRNIILIIIITITNLLYDMISKELDDKYDSSEIQKKQKELEKKFNQEYGEASVKPADSGNDEIYKPNFPFYNQRQFLASTCDTDVTMDSIHEPSHPKPTKRSKRGPEIRAHV